MPTSHRYQLSEIIDLICFTHPQRLLDIGIEFGKYGFLAREYLEIWDKSEQYDAWHWQIDGIEAFSEYIRPWHEQIYDNIFLGDARAIVPTLTTSYDLTLLIDVLEHFTYADGWELIQQLQRHTRNILISTSKDIGHQGDDFGNDYETHRFQCTRVIFARSPMPSLCLIPIPGLSFAKLTRHAFGKKYAAAARGISYSDMHLGPYGSIANYIYTIERR